MVYVSNNSLFIILFDFEVDDLIEREVNILIIL